MQHNKNIPTDAIFSNPKLANIYDAFDGEREDLKAYRKIVKDAKAQTVIDLGCGTGAFALQLAHEGLDVLGIDPAEASINVARSKPGSDEVTWIVGDASALKPDSADAIVMTGNTAQAIVDGEQWMSTLVSVKAALKAGGYFIFETRKPDAEAWKNWNKETSFKTISVPGIGKVDGWVDLVSADLPLVSFRWTYFFHEDATELTSDSTLRFRTLEELVNDLTKSGLVLKETREAPDRPGQEYVILAQA